MSPETIAAIASLIAAVGVIVTAILSYRSKRAAEEGQRVAAATAANLVVVEGVVRELGPALDGRLSDLLKAEIGKAFSEGKEAGAQAQRDRTAEPTA